MQIFVICPVRDVPPDISRRIDVHVTELERQGHEVHWPERDTPQTGDPIGLNTCLTNLAAIYMAAEVHIWYDPTSEGSLFDLGALVMLTRTMGRTKRIVLLNRDEVIPTSGKSFANVVLALAAARNEEVCGGVRH